MKIIFLNQETVKILFAIFLFTMLFVSLSLSAGVTISNPAEYAVIKAGEDQLQSTTQKQLEALKKIDVKIATLYGINYKIRVYEEKYNKYLSAVSSFMTGIKAGSTIYLEGMEVLLALKDLKAAIKHNPNGVLVSGISMNRLYLDIGAEFLRTFNIMSKIVDKGGDGNMHTGAERVMFLWDLSQGISHLRSKIEQLTLIIGVSSYEDLWNKAIAGKISKTNKVLAKESMKRMRKGLSLSIALFNERKRYHSNPNGFINNFIN